MPDIAGERGKVLFPYLGIGFIRWNLGGTWGILLPVAARERQRDTRYGADGHAGDPGAGSAGGS